MLGLSDGLLRSRFLVLILSKHAVNRPWVDQEWTAFMAAGGLRGRIIPVVLESVDTPTIIKSIQTMDATNRDAVRVAKELVRHVGKPSDLKDGDARSLYIGQDLTFVVGQESEQIRITDPRGRTRNVEPPWKTDKRFGIAYLGFGKLTKEPITNRDARAEVHRHAAILGSLLFELLFGDQDGRQLYEQATIPGQDLPLVTIVSNDELLLSLPWELLHDADCFLVRDARLDLVRSMPGQVAGEAVLKEPSDHFKLVVNVSAPEGGRLNYEAESYRITRALSERCRMTPTELGTLDDLVETVRRAEPTGIHFSGHGSPGSLQFRERRGPRRRGVDRRAAREAAPATTKWNTAAVFLSGQLPRQRTGGATGGQVRI